MLSLLLALLFFTYLGYPAWLWLWRRVHARPVHRQPNTPTVSVLLAVYNEAERLPARLDNISRQDYPMDRVEIVVVSDGSSDDTDNVLLQIAARWRTDPARPRLRPVLLAVNCGKPAALNQAAALASGDILVFADARQHFEPDVMARLLDNFADDTIGAVSGRLCFRPRDADTGEAPMGAYWALEQRVRQWQSDSGSVMGVTGAVYAMRASLYTPLPAAALVDDLLQPLYVLRRGFRVALDSRAVAWDQPPAADALELRRKVRTLTGVWQCVVPALGLLPARPGLWLRFVAHKFLRLLMPWVLLAILCLSLASDSPGWQVFGALQLLGYAVALLGLRVAAVRRLPLAGTASVFVLLNIAAARSLFHFLRGDGQRLWAAPPTGGKS
ncbi:MAG: glycosyltransferase [Alcanivoracaceae bacterium]|nr:glycosyltransferase [Alcanivoracaceae bacterium]